MARIRGDNHAFGWPGLEPRWTHGDKDGIGTAYSASGTVSSPRSITRPLICPRCETSSFFLLMVNPSFIRRQSIWRAAFSACHLAWDTALKGRTRKAAMLTSEPNQRGLLRAAGEQEDFRPLFAHQKTGPSAGLGSPRTHLLGTCSPADRRICVSSWAGRAGDA